MVLGFITGGTLGAIAFEMTRTGMENFSGLKTLAYDLLVGSLLGTLFGGLIPFLVTASRKRR
jgi:hypothetical protein